MGPDAVAQFVKGLGPPKVWSVGTVTAVHAATVDVAWMGDSFTVHWLNPYNPAVGDVVLLLTGGQQLIVLGSIST